MTKPIHPRDLAANRDAADPFDPAHAADADFTGDAATPPPAEDAPNPAAAGPLAFKPVPVRPRLDGWTAERQRRFIRALAETGSVGEACEEAGVTARSAYRLRLRPGAESFDAAWRRAYELGIHRLTAMAFERAIHGTRREITRGGETIVETLPSDKLLMFLLQRYDSMRYGKLSGLLPVPLPDPTATAQAEMPQLLAGLRDQPAAAEADDHERFDVLR